MTFELHHIALIGISYLLILSAIAHAANSGWIPQTITNHPATYILSLGIFFSAWSFYGIIELAHQFGYGALAYYMGTGAFFLFSPIIQAPLAELCQRFQLRSIADLLVFRYNSQLAGSLATLFITFALVPLLVLQIQAVADTLLLITADLPIGDNGNTHWRNQRHTIAIFYCLLITVFCMIFGVGYNQYKALITTMAFESLVKVFALMAVGLFAIYSIFGGFGELDTWLLDNYEYMQQLYNPRQNNASHILLLVFISTGVLMPHVFHMSHMDRSIHQISRMVTWAFPLFLLMMALPVFPILWAGFNLGVAHPVTYFTLGVPQAANAPILTVLAWLGGLSAASGALVVSVLSLATMMLNQWVLPLLSLKTQKDIYAQLRWLQRLLIIAIILCSYGLYLWLNNRYSLMDLALLSFIQALQFVPGVIAISYWPRANRYGFYAGLSAGTAVWLIGLAIPVITRAEAVFIPLVLGDVPMGVNAWDSLTLISIGVNIAMFIAVSYLTPMSDEEHYQAEVCAEDELSQPIRRTLDVTHANQFKEKLAETLGANAAKNEVNRALEFLGLDENETRPYALRRLRARIRINLAGLMGQSMANDIIDKHFPFCSSPTKDVFDINLMENRLDRLGNKLYGLNGDINQLRLHHRKTLQDLPIAICSVGMDDEVLLWNHAMAVLTGISSQKITGSNISNIPDPWGKLIADFANDPSTHINKESIDHQGNTRWYRLHKSAIQEKQAQRIEGQAILIEDITEIQLMEQELIHNTRLASIGRLAAGVAHEIGNPVTAIACLAQNLRYEEDPEEQIATANAVLRQTERISRIVESLVSYAHAGKTQRKDFQQVNLFNCINESIHLLSLQKDRKPVEYQNLVDKDAWVWGDTQRLIQVFVNLLSNAHDASPEYSSVQLISRVNAPFLEVELTDEGSGIPKEYLEQVMDPFFTTKDTGKGTGLGLSIVFNIIEEHQGHIQVTSPIAHGKGTRFTLKLPLGSADASSSPLLDSMLAQNTNQE
ncbi:MAG: PAS domain S-box protein [Cellvibrionaceae bacterium]|nr:PAS domain S-box protein [Cellvibrionaceae bacterium]